jgi:acetyl esterase/lipase
MTSVPDDPTQHPPSDQAIRRLVALSSDPDRAGVLGHVTPLAFDAGRLDPVRLNAILGASGSFDIRYGDHASSAQTLDLFQPPMPSDHDPCVLIVHGGGWVGGDKCEFIPLALALARRGFKVASINYRLAPAHPFPAALHDVQAALRFLCRNARRFGIDANRIAGWGASSGAHLVTLAACTLGHPSLDLNPADPSRFRCVIAMAGPMDLTVPRFIDPGVRSAAMSFAHSFLGCSHEDDPHRYQLASPIRHVRPDTPPMLVLVGSEDHPCIEDGSLDRLRALGVRASQTIIPQAGHGCWHRLAHFDQTLDAACQFFTEQL